MAWVAAVDYRKGIGEAADGKPCRNFGKLEKLDNGIVLGAVADGALGVPQSHIGAKTAVRAAMAGLKSARRDVEAALADTAGDGANVLFDQIFEDVALSLRKAAFEQVASLSRLACSLIVFCADARGLIAMQVGEGYLVYRQRGGGYDFVFDDTPAPADFITATDARAGMRVSRRRGAMQFLCVASGALQPLSIDQGDGAPIEPFFRSLDRYASVAIDDGEVHRGIREFLRSDRLSRKIDTDLALALCRYREQSAVHAVAGYAK